MADLYLLRHGIAEERSAGRPDETRKLTEKGRRKLGQVLEAARAAGVRPGVVVSSPLVRAVQTAEMAVEILGGELERDEALSPDSNPEAVVAAARTRSRKGPVILVGHEPLLGRTATFLLQAPEGAIELKKAALACFETEMKPNRNASVLKWLLTPRVSHGL
jgi:phosphohistidine phosphatase